MKTKTYQKRRQTEINIERAKAEAKDTLKVEPTEVKQCKAIVRHRDISRNARYFFWMTLHDAYMIGTNWLRLGFAEEFQESRSC